jgi:hypothetical protein
MLSRDQISEIVENVFRKLDHENRGFLDED